MLVKKSIIAANKLSGKHYFRSLVAEGKKIGLISDETIEKIGRESFVLLKTQTETLTDGKTTSIKSETAEKLISSVYYTVGLALKAEPSPEAAIEKINGESLTSIFKNGQKILLRKIDVCRLLFKRLEKSLFPTPNEFYRSTFIDGMNGFFKAYVPNLFADDKIVTADYPLYVGLPDLDGVEFIEKYLDYALCENAFLNCFSPNKVNALLSSLDENYKDIPLNIYGFIAIAALSSAVTEKLVRSLECDKKVFKDLINAELDEVIPALKKSGEIIVSELGLSDSVRKYFINTLPELISSILRSNELNAVEKTVLNLANNR